MQFFKFRLGPIQCHAVFQISARTNSFPHYVFFNREHFLQFDLDQENVNTNDAFRFVRRVWTSLPVRLIFPHLFFPPKTDFPRNLRGKFMEHRYLEQKTWIFVNPKSGWPDVFVKKSPNYPKSRPSNFFSAENFHKWRNSALSSHTGFCRNCQHFHPKTFVLKTKRQNWTGTNFAIFLYGVIIFQIFEENFLFRFWKIGKTVAQKLC
jgi:hypothetical protein